MYNLRLAKEKDWKDIAPMGRDFYDFSGYPIEYDEDSAKQQFMDILEGPGEVIVAEEDGKPVGFIGFLTHPFPLNRHVIMATELAWWVDPPHRGSPVGKILVSSAEYIAKEKYKAAYFTMSKLRESHPMLERFYKRAGYHEEDTSYMKEL